MEVHLDKPVMRYGFTPLTSDDARILDGPVTNDEIEQALFHMNGWKAPGPDGFQAN